MSFLDNILSSLKNNNTVNRSEDYDDASVAFLREQQVRDNNQRANTAYQQAVNFPVESAVNTPSRTPVREAAPITNNTSQFIAPPIGQIIPSPIGQVIPPPINLDLESQFNNRGKQELEAARAYEKAKNNKKKKVDDTIPDLQRILAQAKIPKAKSYNQIIQDNGESNAEAYRRASGWDAFSNYLNKAFE